MTVAPQELVRSAPSAADIVRHYGGPVSTALLDSSCQLFSTPGIEGLIGFKVGLGCAVAIGDPACAVRDMPALAEAFRAFCKNRGWHTAYAVAGQAFTDWASEHGYAAIEFGEELILDPKRDPQAGSRGRELRKKVQKASREGVSVTEYRRGRGVDHDLERTLEQVAKAWLDARTGPQVYLAHVALFDAPEIKRWFYAQHGGRVVGLLSLMQLRSRGGYLLDHHMVTPDAPIGTSEQLIVEGLRALGAEGCSFATFGPAPSNQLGKIAGLTKLSETMARSVFDAAGRAFNLDSKVRYRQKFQVARTEPSYLLFDPPQVGLREAYGLLRAFNVSVWL